MVFSSVIFLFYFFPIVLFFYFLAKESIRNIVLLVASLFFYAWGEPFFVVILLISVLLNYVVGIQIERNKDSILKRIFLVLGLCMNVGILFYFKYVDFFIEIVNAILFKFHIDFQLQIIGVSLPIGLSFFIFQEISYIIDVYRKDVPAQKKVSSLALYISMFPQLIAGPIVRYSDVYKDIDNRKSTLEDIALGLQRFIIGLGQKVILADILAGESRIIFHNAQYAEGGITPLVAWIGAIAYTFQIYFDFCGYSNMAIGMARIFGFRLSENFRLPYISTSLSEFWRRWHISLGSWFRDYLYIPLGGNKKGNVYFNLFIVFLCTGLWHGAAWAFVFWGLWHGFFVIIERFFITRKLKLYIPKVVKWLYTMLVVIIGWIFFGIGGLHTGFDYIKVMFGNSNGKLQLFSTAYYVNGQIIVTLLVAFLLSIGIPQKIFNKIMANEKKFVLKNIIIETGLLAILFCSMIMIVNGNFSPFIYFRF